VSWPPGALSEGKPRTGPGRAAGAWWFWPIFAAASSTSVWRLCLVVLLVSLAVARGEGPEISGHYEHQLYLQKIHNGDAFVQDHDKLRLDLVAEVGGNAALSGDVVYRVFRGSTEYNALDFIPVSTAAEHARAVGLSLDGLRPAFAVAVDDEHYLDNASVALYLGRIDLRVGKQQLPWGTGYTWNPTDLFNDKNLLDPTYEKVGVQVFRIDARVGLEGKLTAILGVEETWQRSTRAARVAGFARGFDLSACVAEKREERLDYLTGAGQSEQRRLFGLDFSGELWGTGVWGEAAHSRLETSRDFSQYLLGVDYTTRAGTYGIAEYYHDGGGQPSKGRYTFADWMRMLSASGESLGRDYAFAGLTRPAAELWTLSAYSILNLSDRSGVVFPWIGHSLGDDLEISLVGHLPFGSNGAEFGELGPGALARIRVHF